MSLLTISLQELVLLPLISVAMEIVISSFSQLHCMVGRMNIYHYTILLRHLWSKISSLLLICSNMSLDDNLPNSQHLNNIKKAGVWVEDVVIATFELLCYEVHVNISAASASPLICTSCLQSSSSSNLLPPILLAFFQPGHYRVVTKSNDRGSNFASDHPSSILGILHPSWASFIHLGHPSSILGN